MRIDMHTHCLPASICAHHQPEQLPQMFKDKGIDCIVLTNHCYPTHCNKLGDTLKEQAEKYVEVYHRCKAKAAEIDFKVFFGMELKLINEPHRPEFLLYGISEKLFLESYPLFNSTQKQLFDFCNAEDIVMVQAHPYRTEQGYAPCDMQYVHGIEVYNPHLLFDARYEDALKLAEENGKIKTSGSDFHVEEQAGLAGMIVPDDIEDQFMLRDFLKKNTSCIFNEKCIMYQEDKNGFSIW